MFQRLLWIAPKKKTRNSCLNFYWAPCMCVGYMYTVEWRLKSHISPQYPSSDNVVKVLPWTPKKNLKKRGICFNSFPKLLWKKVKISYFWNCAVNQWKCWSTKTMWTRKFFKRLNRWRIFELLDKEKQEKIRKRTKCSSGSSLPSLKNSGKELW